MHPCPWLNPSDLQMSYRKSVYTHFILVQDIKKSERRGQTNTHIPQSDYLKTDKDFYIENLWLFKCLCHGGNGVFCLIHKTQWQIN